MKAKELIALLSKNPNAEVLIMNSMGEFVSVDSLFEDEAVYSYQNNSYDLLSDYKDVEQMRDVLGEDYLDFVSVCVVE